MIKGELEGVDLYRSSQILDIFQSQNKDLRSTKNDTLKILASPTGAKKGEVL